MGPGCRRLGSGGVLSPRMQGAGRVQGTSSSAAVQQAETALRPSPP